jgi:hypothetical protein
MAHYIQCNAQTYRPVGAFAKKNKARRPKRS